jgi:predicted transcriptional regulator
MKKKKTSKKHSTIGGHSKTQGSQMNMINEARFKHLEEENEALKQKNKTLSIDKTILMKMIKDMIEKAPESGSVIDTDLFKNTLQD